MPIDLTLDERDRSMLDTTLKSIEQLKETERNYFAQEAEVLKHIASLEIKLREARKQHVILKGNLGTVRQSIIQMEGIEQNLCCAISSMRHLPEDVLLYIFRMIVQQLESERDEAATRLTMRPNADRFTLRRLSRVCSQWRGVITENISLWTMAEVRSALASGRTRDRRASIDKHSMKMAKSPDRSLALYGWCRAEKEYIRKLLGPGPVEWKAIQISIAEGTLDASTWDVEAHSAREVTIICLSSVPLNYFLPLIRHASTVVLYGSLPHWGSLPWIRLRSLTIRSPARNSEEKIPFGSVEFISLLKAATELTSLVIDFLVNEDILATEDAPVLTHRNIQNLSVHLHHFVAGKGLFGVQLKAPSLKTLDFISLRCKASVDVLPFLCQWDDPEILSITAMGDKEVLLAAELTKWMPNVHTLQVVGRNVDVLLTFIHSLLYHIPPHSFPLPLPKLSTLFIADTDLRGETLIELLENRLRHVQENTPGVCAITEVKMYNSPSVTPVHWSRVQELLKEGINEVEKISGNNMDS